MWTSMTISRIVEGELHGSETATFRGCVIDSRKAQNGEIFIAIQGENTDGHRFISRAFEAGAAIALAQTDRLEAVGFPDVPPDKALIVVPDSLQALQELAKAWRQEIGSFVVGITGSCGKTTTKDMAAAVLAKKFRVHKNLENQNNEIGMPMTILNAPEDTEIMVLEMGMRQLGQIEALCEICCPSIGVITNIGTTHLEFLGSQENIAQAKWELINSLPTEGIAVLNADDQFSMIQATGASVRKVLYGINEHYAHADILGTHICSMGPLSTRFEAIAGSERTEVTLPLPGEHHVLDALAALAVGILKGISLEEGAKALADFTLSKMRLEILHGVHRSTILNDVYNANPDSMKASLKVLAERGGARTVAILGEMYELGDESVAGHRSAGRAAAELGINALVTAGKMAEDIAQGAVDAGFPKTAIRVCCDCREAAECAKEILADMGDGAWVLVKGSRGMHMEKVSEALTMSAIQEPFDTRQ
ncbi:UDP-N-acetylmuramoyl-tripeptide--D-alanyl-D-alanine ligase [Dehalobacter sp. DCM]|uniref:UDP-N-acetylmuramoyl-tripeptide--D-alanyl-D- alanine ligase n=1 Tax=Dehalobacter sp. DCM TaxID=2907827 RepID=UPI0030813FF1|nr:UDP-N-acetylmuramoyl-tripeptide--D-alanyl-D-alanine ligase [Dehalobacter sp. DCM]